MPVILWTDALIFLLCAVVAWQFFTQRNNPALKRSWSKAYRHPTRMIAMMVLLFYVTLGLLDSLHYRSAGVTASGQHVYSNKISSVLDWILLPSSAQQETSYSAPFATELFNKEMDKSPEGTIIWRSTKLEYVQEKPIVELVTKGAAQGLGAGLLITLIFWLLSVKLFQQRWSFRSPWFVGWISLMLVLMLAAVCKQLSQYYHILGTDKVGTDIFYASLKSIRTGLIIGTLTTLITMPFAILFGALAGYLRGWVDDAIQYLYTTISSVPGVLLIAAGVLSLDAVMQRNMESFGLVEQRADMRLLLLCCILGLTSWTSLCRILRGETLKMREHEFVLAARVMGLSSLQIIRKHIVPNLLHIILIALVLDFSGLVLAEAVLSYVGVGVDPSSFSWGNMINSARMELGRDPIIWWSLTGAFIFMFGLVLSANVFADGVRDAFDAKAE